jgi:hypothetical protein
LSVRAVCQRHVTNGKTKTERIVDVLNQLNFVVDEPPSGWVTTVEKEMYRRGDSVHQTTIYDARRKAVRRLKNVKPNKSAPSQSPPSQSPPSQSPPESPFLQALVNEAPKNSNVSKASAAPVSVPAPAPVVAVAVAAPKVQESLSLTLADAKVIKEFAQKFGGLKGLAQAVQAVDEFLS